MQFTGGLYVPGQPGTIELEHRYLCVAEVVVGRDVLDMTFTDGHGAALLARKARRVVGIEQSTEAVRHARERYQSNNIEFRERAAAIPLDDAAVDVVVDFAPEAHCVAMLDEVKRVLRPGGVLIVSGTKVNRDKFERLLRAGFSNVSIYGQRVVHGSALLREGDGPVASFVQAESTDTVRRSSGVVDPTCLVALASNVELPKLDSGVFELQQKNAAQAINSEVTPTVERDVEPAQQAASLNSLGRSLFEARTEIIRLQREKKQAEASVGQLSARIGVLEAALHAYKSSWSWRVSAPLRVLTRAARTARNLAMMPLRFAANRSRPPFSPIVDVEVTKSGFVSTGNDPQFRVTPAWTGLKAGWAMVELDIEADGTHLNPILYAFSGHEGSQAHAFPIASYKRGLERRLIVLPPDVRSLRFDPTDQSGVSFTIRHLSVCNLSKIGLAREAFSALDAGQRAAFVRAIGKGNLGLAKTLLQGGITSRHDSGEYRAWVELHDSLSPDDIAAIHAKCAAMPVKPLISVLMPVYNTRPKYLRKALDSVLAQLYENWELCIADDASPSPEIRRVLEEYMERDSRVKVVFRQKNGHISAASNSALEIVTGEFVALMDHDDAIPAHALYMVADEIVRHPDVDLIYTDEDKVDENDRRHDAHFKTDWNRELFYSQNFIAHMGVYRTSIVRKINGFRVGFEGSQDYDFVLRFLMHTEASKIRHIPHVLYHWRIFPGVTSFSTDNPDSSVETARRALVEYFQQAEPTAEVVGITQFPGWWRIKRKAPDVLPRVSLIVPTRDRLNVLKSAVEGLMHSTRYDNLEIIIVDNGSIEAETLQFFEQVRHDPRVKILRDDGPFNFSALNNRAAAMATGSILGFINNDIEVIHDDWLLEMVAQVSRPGVGAVGAKLYYANETIQHAGVIMGLYGVAAHGHRHFPRNSVGYFGRPLLTQNLSAVTAACMLVPKSAFEEVGGYDEENLTVGYNDVDLCLKIRAAGYDVVYTPFAELYHLESVSRGNNVSAAQVERDARERSYMLSRWADVIARDPFYSPNLTVSGEDFSLAFPPRAYKPWLE